MRDYEVTFIVDPVLSGEEIKAIAQTYVDLLKNEGCEIVHVDEMGLRPLAYPINKRNSGVYYCIEFRIPAGSELIDNVELALRRDERIMRFLTVSLDKFGVKYNEDKRNGLIAKAKKSGKPKDDGRRDGRDGRDSRDSRDNRDSRPPMRENRPAETAAPAEVAEPVVVAAPVVVAPPVAVVKEEEE